jgi:serine/threonine protein kinase/tetratricopeptide (TPR) repeat protein
MSFACRVWEAMKQIEIEFDELSATDRQLLANWLAEFEQAWSPTHLQQCLRDLPPEGQALRLAALAGMVCIDLRRQWQAGTPQLVEQYLKSFPELAASEKVLLPLLQTEYVVRQGVGNPVSATQLALRFPKHQETIRTWKPPPEEVDFLTIKGEPPKKPPQSPLETPQPRETAVRANPASVSLDTDLAGEFGRYRIVRRLGRGGMGSVYLARDTQLARDVALKVPNFHDDEDSAVQARFLQEARAAAVLRHVNICSVYDVGRIGVIHYLTMAYIEGEPLSNRLRGRTPLPVGEALELTRVTALALAYAHRQGVIHRDLKPSNLMITPQGDPVIMDFGLARRGDQDSSRLTRTGETLGTLAYMPPEQLRGELSKMGPASDVYSLGAILFEALTGRLPFEGPTALLVNKLLTEDAPSLSRFAPKLAIPRLEALVRKSLAKKVGDRFPSMEAFAAELSKCQESLRNETSSGAKASQPRRRGWVAALLIAGFLVAIACAYHHWFGAVHHEEPSKADPIVVAKHDPVISEPPPKPRTTPEFSVAVPSSPDRVIETPIKPPSKPPEPVKVETPPKVTPVSPPEPVKSEPATKVTPVAPPPPVTAYELAPPPVRVEIPVKKTPKTPNTANLWSDHLNKARKSRQAGDLEGALRELAAAERAAPDDISRSEAILERARVSRARGSFAAAVADAREAMRLTPALKQVADLELARASNGLWDYESAIAACDRILADSPAPVMQGVATIERAVAHLGRYQYAEASRDIADFFRTGGNHASGFRARAAYLHAHQYDAQQALVEINRAIRLDATDAEAYLLRASINLRLRKYDEAIADCDEAGGRGRSFEAGVERLSVLSAKSRSTGTDPKTLRPQVRTLLEQAQPDSAPTWYLVSSLHRMNGDTDAALKACDKAVELQPKSARVLLARATIRVERNENDRALEDCQKVLELSPDNARAYYLKGQVRLHQAEYDDALREYDEARRYEPRMMLAVVGRSNVFNRRKDFDRAITECSAGLEIEPDNASLLFNRAFARTREDKEGALSDYDHVLKLDPLNASAWNNRGLLKGHAKQYEKALSDFDEAIRLNPKAMYYTNRAAVYDKLKRPKDAEADRRRAKELQPNDKETRLHKAQIDCISSG